VCVCVCAVCAHVRHTVQWDSRSSLPLCLVTRGNGLASAMWEGTVESQDVPPLATQWKQTWKGSPFPFPSVCSGMQVGPCCPSRAPLQPIHGTFQNAGDSRDACLQYSVQGCIPVAHSSSETRSLSSLFRSLLWPQWSILIFPTNVRGPGKFLPFCPWCSVQPGPIPPL
jgi:hypothetical protein